MPGAVHVEGLVGLALDQLVDLAGEQTQLHQAGSDHPQRGLVGLVPVLARGNFVEGGFLGAEHQFVDGLLLGGEGAADREGAGDVAGVAVDLAGRIDQHQIAVLEHVVVLAVVQDAGIAAGRDDRAVGRQLGAPLAELVVKLGLQVVLVQPCTAGLHGTHMGSCGDFRSLAHHRDLASRLDQAHLMQAVVEGDELGGHRGAMACLAAHVVDPADQLAVELGVDTHGVVNAREAGDQAGENLIDDADGEGLVGAVVAQRALLAGAQAVPQLTLGIALAAEQHVLAMLAAGDQGHHRFRLGEAGEVLEVAVLAVNVLDIAVADVHRRRRQDGDAVGLHLLHQRLAPTGVFRLRDTDHAETSVQ
ncbi:hypothetical protein D9M71_129890 [compost metagenome]